MNGNYKLPQKPRVFICGPTGVGKSSFAEKLAQQIHGEIINADVFQMYEPLSIGTAKPDLSQVSVPHHLFSTITIPQDYTVSHYRAKAFDTIKIVESKENVPCVVGGSGFYMYSLFFPPFVFSTILSSHTSRNDIGKDSRKKVEGLSAPLPENGQGRENKERENKENAVFTYDDLRVIDPQRAKDIHPSDHYRIQRACEIFYSYGFLPSSCAPQYVPIENAIVFFVERDREELFTIIDTRVDFMIDHGWIDEVAHLSHEWQEFTKKKNILGYPQLIEYLQGAMSLQAARTYIKQVTRNYAKRQITFNRRFAKKLLEHNVRVYSANLTLSSSDLYIEHIVKELFK